MFTTFKQRIALAFFVLIILSIPVGAYVISEQQSKDSTLSTTEADRKIVNNVPITSAKPSPTPEKKDLLSLLEREVEEDEESIAQPTTAPVSTIATTFGPTLDFKITVEGRPLSNQTSKLFVGITDGKSPSPQYVLSFSVDMPASGSFSGLSLAGLTVGQSYHAYIKGPAQIATSSAFTMGANITNLNGGVAIPLVTGDLNEDNTINSADYTIAKALYNANENSASWNANVDLNKDGIINAADLAIIIKNFGKTGSSGVWQSTPTQGLAAYTKLEPPILGSTQASASATPSGYWIWVPK